MSSVRSFSAALALLAGLSGAAFAYTGQVPLTATTVTTSGTPVTALQPGGASAGGMLITQNAAGICVNQLGAAGTTTGSGSGGSTVCVLVNQRFDLLLSPNAVSVNAPASGVVFGGWGLN